MKWILPAVLFATSVVLFFWSAYYSEVMLDLVNQRLPADRQISLFGKRRDPKVKRLYRELYPGGDLARKGDRLGIAGSLFWFLAVAALIWLGR